MKKLISLILALALIFTLAACSKPVEQESPVNAELQGYFDEGYDCSMYSIVDGTWTGILEKEDGSYIKVTFPITEAQQALFEAIDISDEDYDAKENALILTFLDATCEPILPPTQEELNAYVGKTLSEMVDEGFECFDEYLVDEESYILTLYGTAYNIHVTVEEKVNSSNVNDFSQNEKESFKIATVEFVEFVL